MRGETMVFEIGRPFVMGDRVWICTDVGSRTICAVPLDDLEASGDSGPPYSIVEHVLDHYAMDGCRPLPQRASFAASASRNRGSRRASTTPPEKLDGARRHGPGHDPWRCAWPPRTRRRPWREQFRAIRSALRQADRLTGTLREHALIRVCRALVAAERDAPEWHIDSHGNGYRVTSAETRVYDRAERTLEISSGPSSRSALDALPFALYPRTRRWEPPAGGLRGRPPLAPRNGNHGHDRAQVAVPARAVWELRGDPKGPISFCDAVAILPL
jgi:hypothetical protein